MLSELFRMETILGFCEKVCYFLAVNLLFAGSSLPVLLFFLFIGIGQAVNYFPLFMLCMISVPPAFCGVLYAMRRLLDGRERGPFRDYVKGYRNGFVRNIKIGGLQLLALFILWTNLRFFTSKMIILPAAILFFLLFVFALIISPNLYVLASRYEMRCADIIKTACVLTITRPACTLGTAAAFALMLIFFELAAGTAVLFMISLYGFLVVFITKGVLNSLEKSQ